MLSGENIHSAIARIKEKGIPMQRSTLREISQRKDYAQSVKGCLDPSFKKVVDEESFRSWVCDMFGVEGLEFFVDAEGYFVTDLEHALTLYYAYKHKRSKLTNNAKGIVYFLGNLQLERELKQLSYYIKGGILIPNYRLTPYRFSWSQCPAVFRKYIMSLVDKPDHKLYYCEPAYLAKKSYLTSRGVDIAKQEALLKQNKGLFVKYLPKKLEDLLVPRILAGDVQKLEGSFSEEITDGFLVADNSTSPYTLDVKPYMIDVLGSMLGQVKEEYLGSTGREIEVPYLSEYRFMIALPKNEKLADVLPESTVLFKEVQPFSEECWFKGLLL